MLFMCYGIDGPDGAARRDLAREEHFAYLKANEDIMVLGGATLADADDTRTGSVLIINVPDRAAAEAFADGEPLRKAGVFESYKITRMRRGQWYPENAPKTAEGD
jgi:uncharacterized protein YciI